MNETTFIIVYVLPNLQVSIAGKPNSTTSSVLKNTQLPLIIIHDFHTPLLTLFVY